jgi:hypothetical protein
MACVQQRMDEQDMVSSGFRFSFISQYYDNNTRDLSQVILLLMEKFSQEQGRQNFSCISGNIQNRGILSEING